MKPRARERERERERERVGLWRVKVGAPQQLVATSATVRLRRESRSQ